MVSPATLTASELTYGFAGKPLGRDLSFVLAPGEVVCLLGPNGSGKTTLLRTLLGLAQPLSGRVERSGVAAYVPQAHAEYFAFSLRELAAMGRARHIALLSAPGPGDRAAVDAALRTLGIAHLADTPVTEVSSGERQLALLARALAQEPQLLVMDEPTASLDFGNQLRVLEHAAALAAKGLSVLFSSHDPGHAFAFAQRVLVLGPQGPSIGAVGEMLSAQALERLYGVPVRIVDAGDGRKACLPMRPGRPL